MEKFLKKLLPILILIITSLIIARPLLSKGYFSTHDGEWAIVRLAEMVREIKDLQFPPRWSDYLNHGYGYPLFNFTYPFPYYMGAGLKLIGFRLVDSIKILFVLSIFISAISMYLLAREIGGPYAGILSSILYTVAPYKLVNLYVRGSIGESLGLSLFPLILYSSLKLIIKPSIFNFTITSLLFSVLILTHNVSALIFFPFWIGFLYAMVFTYYEDPVKYTYKYFIPLLFTAFGLASYFFIPAIIEKKYILLSQIKLSDIKNNFVTLSDFVSSPWSYDKPTFQLGWAHIITVVTGFLTFMSGSKIIKKKYNPLFVYLAVSLFSVILLTNKVSIFIWNLPPLSWIDFPWRMIGLMTLFISMSGIFLSINKYTKIAGTVLMLSVIILSMKFTVTKNSINNPDDYYMTNDATTTSADELMPTWVKVKPSNRYINKINSDINDTKIFNLSYNSKKISFGINNSVPSVLNINTIYFPGWEFSINSKKSEYSIDNKYGTILLNVPSGKNFVAGIFKETPIRYYSNMVSVLSFTVILLLLLYGVIKKI